MFSTQGSDKIQEFVKQAASMHVVNTVYFIGLVVLALFSQYLQIQTVSVKMDVWMIATAVLLSASGLFKLAVSYFRGVEKLIKEEQLELVLTFINVAATFTVMNAIQSSGVGGQTLLLLYTFLPTMLFILISPLTWNKRHREFVGIYGFMEWALLLIVVYWSLSTLYLLYVNEAYLGLVSNGVILIGPYFLKFIRKRHMEKLMGKMYIEIYTDPLTGIKNRKAFYEYYDRVREGNKMREFGYSGLMVIFVDIDHFKAYNDHYGHEMGDDCLQDVSNFLQDVADERQGWEAFRYGGEEFLLVAPMNNDDWCTIQEDELIDEWLKGELTLPREHKVSEFGQVTLSAGGCLVPTDDIYTMNAGMVTKLADKKLYEAKETRAKMVLDQVNC